jgi:hypothetical protein
VKLEDGPTVRFMQEVEITSGALFLLLYAYGVYDANRHFKRDVIVPGSEQFLKNLDKPDKPPEKPKKTSMHWGPIIVPGGVGVGLVLENY